MLDNEIVKVKVAGEFACFTRPDLKVERMTYPCMTPSAHAGYSTPYFGNRVPMVGAPHSVLKPVIFFGKKKRNKCKQARPQLLLKTEAQRNSIVLRDVEYIIEASIYQNEFNPANPPRKYAEMFKRRVKKGQCWRRPYLGTREFAAEFSAPNGTEQPIPDTIPIGSMLFDIFFDEKGTPSPLFFYDVAIVNGILECPQAENEKMMQSSHLQPGIDNEISTAIYNFNLSEEKEAML
jgi:CRISPR-associated protein Cas5d